MISISKLYEVLWGNQSGFQDFELQAALFLHFILTDRRTALKFTLQKIGR